MKAQFRGEARAELIRASDAFTGLCRSLCAEGPCSDYWRLHACRWNYGPYLELGYGEPRSGSWN